MQVNEILLLASILTCYYMLVAALYKSTGHVIATGICTEVDFQRHWLKRNQISPPKFVRIVNAKEFASSVTRRLGDSVERVHARAAEVLKDPVAGLSSAIDVGGYHLNPKVTDNLLEQTEKLRHVCNHLLVRRPTHLYFRGGPSPSPFRHVVTSTVSHADPLAVDFPRRESVVDDWKQRADGKHCGVWSHDVMRDAGSAMRQGKNGHSFVSMS